jgi:2-polyprenyl-3-methyl-5-hydroxy-6-metoxy-1,4-benzoquinol methylase
VCSPNSSPLTKCLACGSDKLKLTLDLGKQPPANSYKNSKDEVQEEFPLAINRCLDCYHVQLTHVVNPDILYKDYLYVSGTSKTMADYFDWFARWSVETHRAVASWDSDHLNVLDVGCNDGSQLDAYRALALRSDRPYPDVGTYGVDPAENLHATSTGKGHRVHLGYFDDAYMERRLNEPGFDMIVAQNVFAHNPDPESFLCRASALLGQDGLLFVQTSQADMILNNEFDTIYHEHISFYNINSMNELCRRTKCMFLVDVLKTPLHGNSYVFIISSDPERARPEHIANLIAMERKAGLLTDDTYVKYEKRVQTIASQLLNAIHNHHRNEVGWPIIAYGAAAKGMTLLNYVKPPIDFIIDDNPLKQGKFTPGRGIPIVSIDALKKYEKETCLFVPLAWNFFDEIRTKIERLHPTQYDKYVRYFPEVKVE